MFSRKMALVVILVGIVTFSGLALVLSSRQPSLLHGPDRLIIMMVAPVQKVITGSIRLLRDVWDHYFFLIYVVDENRSLRESLQKAAALNYELREIELTNQRLGQLLQLKENLRLPMIAAQVIGKDPSPWFQTIMVDKGTREGVTKGLPVIHAEGIVGLVVDATFHYAKVMLITDPNSAVDAIVQESRARGTIKGGTSGYCLFDYVLRKHRIQPGDTVVTSGMDGVFPKGMPVGRVAEINNQNEGIFQHVTLLPFVDFERLEDIAIILSPRPVQP